MRTTTGSNSIPRIPLRLIVVAAGHVGLFYIVTGALRFEPPVELPTITGDVFDDRRVVPPIDEKPVNPFKAESITVDRTDPPPPIDYEETPEPPAKAAQRTDGISLRNDGSAEVVARFVPVRADPNRPLTRAPYPAASIRLEEEGVVELSIRVLPDGRIAEVRVVKSSGYPRLDRAAIEEARRSWRLLPAMQGDEPVDAWGGFRVVFRLDRR